MKPTVTIVQSAAGFLAVLEFPTGAMLGRWFKSMPTDEEVLHEYKFRKKSFRPV